MAEHPLGDAELICLILAWPNLLVPMRRWHFGLLFFHLLKFVLDCFEKLLALVRNDFPMAFVKRLILMRLLALLVFRTDIVTTLIIVTWSGTHIYLLADNLAIFG